MAWNSFLRSVVTSTVARAANLAATSAAGPVVGVAADKTAAAATDFVLDKVLAAETSILTRLDEINQEMRGRLLEIQGGIDALLDQDYKAAQLHIEEAARDARRRDEELHLAKSNLFRAWGAATTPMHRYLVAQHLALVYALLGDRETLGKWLAESRDSLGREISARLGEVSSLTVAWDKQLLVKPKDSERRIFPISALAHHSDPATFMRYEARFERGFESSAYGAKPSRLRLGGRRSKPPPTRLEGLVLRVGDLSLEGLLSGLAKLDAQDAFVRRLCEAVGAPPRPNVFYRWQDGGLRIYKGATHDGTGVVLRYGRDLANAFSVPKRDLWHSPLHKPMPPDLTIGYQWDARVAGAWDEQNVWEMGRTEIVNGVECYIG